MRIWRSRKRSPVLSSSGTLGSACSSVRTMWHGRLLKLVVGVIGIALLAAGATQGAAPQKPTRVTPPWKRGPLGPIIRHPDLRSTARGRAVLPVAPSAFGGTWTPIGPKPISTTDVNNTNYEVSGRVTALGIAPGSGGSTVYMGTMGGGVWKTTDGGTTWAPKSDSQASLSIGALAVDPGNAQVIYAGTGEDNTSTSMYGQGVLKSTNGGDTWALLGQSTFAGHHIGGIAI